MRLIRRWQYGPFFHLRIYLNGKQLKEEIIYESQTSAFAKSVSWAKEILENYDLKTGKPTFFLTPPGSKVIKYPLYGPGEEFVLKFKRRR